MNSYLKLNKKSFIPWLYIWLALTCFVANNIELKFNQFFEIINKEYGGDRLVVAEKWQKMIVDSVGLTEQEKVTLVNRFFNTQLFYQTDIQLWQQNDYWATPLETLGKGMGDCEDYAIAKYVSLRAMGISEDKLRLVYVKAKLPNQPKPLAHMVLGYYEKPNAMPLILDSLINQVLPANKRTDLKPVFSFNSEGLWSKNSQSSVASPTARLSHWRDVIERSSKQGIKW
ncbi:transglutaminase-like cysteine peptidase [Catenovulum sp. 2E275]|uniref:transglutaminase-like cysteine peptidase n=1 Tax=Catenovulum sp. 2E275 TaxID=2980497 RepID=UPI0021D12F2C|nr:transglutaminase-like cysteine peptidase [Catenovulum sp. 2E275]MCU4676844.1 transglutaminase-like cysteine peptidase [Catenovulum sp. 2E275]